MSAFANNPWVKKDKERTLGQDSKPEIKRPVKAPRKISKNPFAEDKKEEPLKPKVSDIYREINCNSISLSRSQLERRVAQAVVVVVMIILIRD